MSKTITVYTTDYCPYCVRAKMLLEQNGFSFKEIKISRDDEVAREELLKKSGMRTFPQIFLGDKLIGGCSDLEQLHNTTGLKNALS